MAISHICLTCGLDLARVRAQFDAALGLPVVTCPECGRHCVRRRHPLIAGWRRGFRLRTALWTLIGQLVVTVVMAVQIAAISRRIAEEMIADDSTLIAIVRNAYRVQAGPGGFDVGGVGPWSMTTWLVASVLVGVWLGSAFPHWRSWAIVPLWALWLIAMLSIEYIALAAFFPFAWLAGADVWRPDSGWWLVAMQVVLASLAISVAATPLGRPARFLWSNVQRKRWRKRLNRVRRIRSGE